MEKPGNISEYWFHSYYRVMVIELEEYYVVSVDVYRDNWLWSIDNELCINDKEYCLVYHYPHASELKRLYGELADYIQNCEIVGVRAKSRVEVVNVRYSISKEKPLTYNNIEQLFYKSWELIGCSIKEPEDIVCR